MAKTNFNANTATVDLVGYKAGTRKLETVTGLVDNVAACATADATTEATSYALGIALKVKLNDLLTKLKASGVMEADA